MLQASSGRYFVSDEAENATLNQVKDAYTKATDAKARLEGKLTALGAKLSDLGAALQKPGRHVFYVDESDSISVGQPGLEPRRAVARITASDLDWKDLCDALRGYSRATEDKKQNAGYLKDMGLPVPSD